MALWKALLAVSITTGISSAKPELTPSQLQHAIDAAIASGASRYTIPPGTYNFSQSQLLIRGAFYFDLVGSGATLLFYPGFGVMIRNAIDTTASALIVDYDPPCFTQGTVIAFSSVNGTADITLDLGYPTPDAQYFNSSEIKLIFFDAATRRRTAQPMFCGVSISGPVSPPGTWRVEGTCLKLFSPQLGWLATISPRVGASEVQIPDFYVGQTWSILNSTRVTTESVTILGGGNFAFLGELKPADNLPLQTCSATVATEWGGGGNHYYHNVTLTRRDPHLVSSNCDAFHSFSALRGPHINASLFSWQGDGK